MINTIKIETIANKWERMISSVTFKINVKRWQRWKRQKREKEKGWAVEFWRCLCCLKSTGRVRSRTLHISPKSKESICFSTQNEGWSMDWFGAQKLEWNVCLSRVRIGSSWFVQKITASKLRHNRPKPQGPLPCLTWATKCGKSTLQKVVRI